MRLAHALVGMVCTGVIWGLVLPHSSVLAAGPSWVRGDYLMWWTKGTRLPPLVTTSPPDTPREEAGVLGLPDTSVLFGDSVVNDDLRSGWRVTAGFWLDCCQTFALEGDFFDLSGKSFSFEASGDGAPILSRPFFNIETGAQSAELVSFPDVISGTVRVEGSDYFQSCGGWFRCNLCCSQSCCQSCCKSCCKSCCCAGCRVDLIGGYRHYRLNDRLQISEDLTVTEPATAGSTFDLFDRFSAVNEFHGGEIGLKAKIYRGRWSLGILAKMALGNNHQVVDIDGQTVIVTRLAGPPPIILPPVSGPAGLLTAETNIERYTRDQFTVIPQLGLELGYKLSCCCRLYVGYNLLYWAHVQRAADQIDFVSDRRNLIPVQPGGTIHPAPQLCSNDFWAQGLNFGCEFRY